MNLIVYPVPPTKPSQTQFIIFAKLLHILSLSPHLIKILSYMPLGKLFECKSIANELDDLSNWDSDGNLTLSRSKTAKNIYFIFKLNFKKLNYSFFDSWVIRRLHQPNTFVWL